MQLYRHSSCCCREPGRSPMHQWPKCVRHVVLAGVAEAWLMLFRLTEKVPPLLAMAFCNHHAWFSLCVWP